LEPTVINELIVFSHLRWDFVWQRPQHLVSRLAQHFDRVLVVEEPRVVADGSGPKLTRTEHDGISRLWLDVDGGEPYCGFDDPRAADYASLLRASLDGDAHRTAWLYSPLALPLANAIEPEVVVYDVMDDLSKFAHASSQMVQMHHHCLRVSDHVFTGGRSLQQLAAQHRRDALCFPSGVDIEHFEPAVRLRNEQPSGRRPVAGYVGVIDERLDLDLIGQLAAELEDWDICIVGPVVKIDPASLPQAPNLTYTGPRAYGDLPAVLAGFDVALMPFALNDATRSISPTKSLEYLAAGLPVVSTRIPDVVADLSAVVTLADDGEEFATACRKLLVDDDLHRMRACRSLLRSHRWDSIADRMYDEIVTPEASGIAAVGS
jgi:glycosyltransferase involved in cell wall biosynthesis